MSLLSLQEKRRKILNQIDKYNTQRCKKCSNTNVAGSRITDCNCQAATNIRKLGDRLLKLVSPRRDERQNEIDSFMNMLTTIDDLTPGIFKELKKLKVTDKMIREKVDLNERLFNLWKIEHDLRNSYNIK